jgi:hypothetical protein
MRQQSIDRKLSPHGRRMGLMARVINRFAATLGDAVRQMGLAQLDRTLSDHQVAAIAAFLNALTGRFHGKPVTAASP